MLKIKIRRTISDPKTTKIKWTCYRNQAISHSKLYFVHSKCYFM